MNLNITLYNNDSFIMQKHSKTLNHKTMLKAYLPQYKITTLTIVFFLLIYGAIGAQTSITVQSQGNCYDATASNNNPTVWNYIETDATGRNVYRQPSNGNNNNDLHFRWNETLQHWEIAANIGDANGFAYYTNTTPSTPNPPDMSLGTWVFNPILSNAPECQFVSLSGDVQNFIGGCNDIIVNSTADNLTAGDGNCTLREAIRNANAGMDLTSGDCSCGTTITFHTSTDNTPIVLNLTGTGEDAAATGDLDITVDGLTITGNGQGTTIIDGNNTDRIFHVMADNATIQSMTVQNGEETSGGALYFFEGSKTLTLSQVTFDNNESTQNHQYEGGGACYLRGVGSTCTITQCTFSNNIANNTLSRGGAILTGDFITTNISNSLFNGNQANIGGGISLNGSANISNTCFQNNTTANNPSSDGGACEIFGGTSHIFTNCTFTGNTAASGGSVIREGNTVNHNILTLISCTIADNTTALSGTTSQALHILNTTGETNLINNIFVNNEDGDGDPSDLNITGTLTTNTNNIVEFCTGTGCPGSFLSNNDDVICGIATCSNGFCHYPVRAGSDADGTADVSSPIADDICGNARNAGAYNIGSSEEDFTDTENPVVTCPSNVSQHAASGQCSAVVTYTGATATDNCGVVMESSTPASGTTFNVGATTVTATAFDATGNMGQCTFTVTVVDNQAPTVSCPANQTAYAASGMTTATVNGIAPAGSNDNCSIASTTYSIMGATTTTGNDDASGTTFNLGMSNVAYTVTDPAGLTGMCSFTVTVVQCGDITVNTSADNLTAGDGNCTLREAIANVNAGTDLTNGDCDCGNTIRFASSTNGNPITIAIAGNNENFNTTGDFDITAGVTIIGNGTSNTIIDGADLDRIFDVGTTDAVSIQALTIQNGTADDFGGGIICATQFADITLDQVNVDNCEALSGGGISMSFINISLTMTSCSVTNNMATIGSGGGLEFYGNSMMVSDCVFNNNMSGSTGGGAEINTAGGMVNFLRTCFVSNSTALLGGGINHFNGNLTFTNCTFSDNEASIGQGGALSSFAFPGTNLSVINCTAAENTSAVGGGFSITQNGGNIDMINTILADNTASGGSGHDLYIDAGTLTTNTNNIVEDCLGNAVNSVVCPTFFSSDDPQLQPITTCGALCYYPLLDCSTAVGSGDQNATGVPTTDICGTAHSAATNIGSSEATTGDTENPVANCPGTQTASNTAGQCGANVSFTIPNPTDNCTASSSASPASGSFFNVGTTQVTVTATDGGGNTDQCTFDVVVNDTENPTASNPAAINVSCPNDVPDPDPAVVTDATDNCANTMCTGEVWINEIHYDNVGGDTGEFVEIAGPAGTDLSSYTLVFHTGSNGTVYNTQSLSGSIDDEGSGIGAKAFFIPAIQNGSPDGIALINNGTVVEFLSYEGTFIANGGDADGTLSTDIGVNEISSTPVGHSVQLKGTGNQSSDFTWMAPSIDSPGDLNAGQSISPCGSSGVNVTHLSDTNNGGVGSTANPLVITRTYQLADAAGNTANVIQTINVIDNEDPTAVCLGTQTVNNDPGQCGTDVFFSLPNPTDNCTGATSTASPASGSFFNVGTTQVTVTATDAAGNTDQCTFNVVVNDNEDPTAVCLGTQTVNNDPGQCGTDVFFSITKSSR